MSHDHPGYDIESSDEDGTVLRYIEVKSLSSDWVAYGAGMTPRHLREGSVQKDRFCLYVVERAVEDPTVFAIHDPISKADEFRFDDTWKLLSEPITRVIKDYPVMLEPVDGSGCSEGAVPLFTSTEILRSVDGEDDSVPSMCARVEGLDSVRFVYADPDAEGTLWLMDQAPLDRPDRLLLVEVEILEEAQRTTETIVGWYRRSLQDGQLVVTIVRPDEGGSVVVQPEYPDDVSVIAEVVGRGVVGT
jgi:hypothetical protein